MKRKLLFNGSEKKEAIFRKKLFELEERFHKHMYNITKAKEKVIFNNKI